jgi:hypothetical protein
MKSQNAKVNRYTRTQRSAVGINRQGPLIYWQIGFLSPIESTIVLLIPSFSNKLRSGSLNPGKSVIGQSQIAVILLPSEQFKY